MFGGDWHSRALKPPLWVDGQGARQGLGSPGFVTSPFHPQGHERLVWGGEQRKVLWAKEGSHLAWNLGPKALTVGQLSTLEHNCPPEPECWGAEQAGPGQELGVLGSFPQEPSHCATVRGSKE